MVLDNKYSTQHIWRMWGARYKNCLIKTVAMTEGSTSSNKCFTDVKYFKKHLRALKNIFKIIFLPHSSRRIHSKFTYILRVLKSAFDPTKSSGGSQAFLSSHSDATFSLRHFTFGSTTSLLKAFSFVSQHQWSNDKCLSHPEIGSIPQTVSNAEPFETSDMFILNFFREKCFLTAK